MEFDINWLAVLAAVIAHQVIGFLWYAVLFKDMWMQTAGKNQEDLEGGPGIEMIIGLVGSALSAVALALILTLSDDPSLGLGIAVGAVSAVGFVAASIFTNGAYEETPPKLSALYSIYQLVGFVVMGGIIGSWP